MDAFTLTYRSTLPPEQLPTFKDVGGPEKGQSCCASPTKGLFACGVLGDGLGALVTACLASSPGSRRRTGVWIFLEVMVLRLL